MKNKHNSGVSILFVMAALIVTSLIGTSLLRMSHSDRLSGVLYSSSESARTAARSGIIAAISRLGTTNPDSIENILDLLNVYAGADNPDTLNDTILWLNGGPDSWQNLSNTQKYRTRIEGFNAENFEISLISDGVGQGNSRATAVALYTLRGLGNAIAASNAPINAIQMDNGNFEFNCQFTVNGNTSVKDNITLHNDGTFNGFVRVDSLTKSDGTKVASQVVLGNPTVFDSTVYFAGGIRDDGAHSLEFKQNIGFDGRVDYINNTTMKFSDSSKVYFNDTVMGQTSDTVDVNGAYIYAHGTISEYNSNSAGDIKGLDIFKNKNPAGPSSLQNSPYNITEELKINSEPDPEIHFNRSIIDTTKIYKKLSVSKWSGLITSDTLIKWYNAASAAGKLWSNEFMVIQFNPSTSDYNPFQDVAGAVPFDKRVIFLIDDPYVRLYKFYESNMMSGISVIYLSNYNTNENILNNTSNFRGFFYIKESSQRVTFANGKTMRGALYFGKDATTKFDGDGLVTVTWDSAAIKAIDSTGIFSDSTGAESDSIILVDTDRIRADILSQAL